MTSLFFDVIQLNKWYFLTHERFGMIYYLKVFPPLANKNRKVIVDFIIINKDNELEIYHKDFMSSTELEKTTDIVYVCEKQLLDKLNNLIQVIEI